MNFTSTKPSASAVPCFTHQGKAPLPDCFRTLGALGAPASASTAQRGAPPPVLPHTHPAGTAPGWVAIKADGLGLGGGGECRHRHACNDLCHGRSHHVSLE